MNEKLNKCPKDPKLYYYQDVCQKIFRKGSARHWCKKCELYEDSDQSENTLS